LLTDADKSGCKKVVAGFTKIDAGNLFYLFGPISGRKFCGWLIHGSKKLTASGIS